jgi:hypothetical protein
MHLFRQLYTWVHCWAPTPFSPAANTLPLSLAADEIHSAASIFGHCIEYILLTFYGGDVLGAMENNWFENWDMLDAAADGEDERIRELHAQGGDVNQCDCDGQSPVWFATRYGHVECIQYMHSR